MNNYTLVTGASSGIGEEFARYFAEKGENIIIIARTENKLKKMKEELMAKYNIKVVYLVKDLTQNNIGLEIYNEVKQKELHVNRLINCAGFATNGMVNDVSLQRQHDEMIVNMVSLFDLTKLFLKDMIQLNSGQIINVASSSAYHPIPTMAVYAATKAFVLSFTEALSLECKGTNVTVFAISPGATDTNFFSDDSGVAFGKKRTPRHVVETTIKAMSKNKISKIDGFNNYFTSTFLPRLLTRKNMVNMVYQIMKNQTSAKKV